MGFIMQLGSARWFCIRVSGINLVHLLFSLIGFIFFFLIILLDFGIFEFQGFIGGIATSIIRSRSQQVSVCLCLFTRALPLISSIPSNWKFGTPPPLMHRYGKNVIVSVFDIYQIRIRVGSRTELFLDLGGQWPPLDFQKKNLVYIQYNIFSNLFQ